MSTYYAQSSGDEITSSAPFLFFMTKNVPLVLALVCCVLALATATSNLSLYSFPASAMLSFASDDSAGSIETASFIVSKDASDRISAVTAFSGIGSNEYFYRADLQVPVLSSTSFSAHVRVGVVPLGDLDAATVYSTLPRLASEAIAQAPANEVGNKIVFDVTAALEAGARAFELVIVGGGASANVVLGVPELQLAYPAWSVEPVESGCQLVNTPVAGVAAPGIVSRECPNQSSSDAVFLYIHGAPSTDDMWDDVAPYMQQFGQVIMVNLPGNSKSGEITGDLTTNQWGALVSDALVAWVHARDLTNLHIAGQDFGGPLAMDLADRLAPEGRVASLNLVEAVSTDQILCPADGTDGCFTDGSAPAIDFYTGEVNPFFPACFGRNEFGCADDILGDNWFSNQTLFFAPKVAQYGALIGGAPVLLAYPFPGACLDNVYELLTTSCHGPAFYDAKYCNGQPCATSPATQGQKYWPRTLYTHGEVAGQHNPWTRDLNLRIRASLESGALAAVPTIVHCADFVFFKTIVTCGEAHAAWAEGHYANVTVNRFGGNMGHFFAEDGFNGAYSFARSQQDALQLASA